MAIGPIDTAPLFGPLDAELVGVLGSLTDEEWRRPTIAGTWRVRDVAAHLLDTSLRRVAASRDGHRPAPDPPLRSAADLSRLVNGLNATGVAFAHRLSTTQLVALIALASDWLATHVASLPPHGRALYPVSWAGEDDSEHWMDIGREYTERWHHQMQIRDAVARPLLLEARWLDPLMDLSVCALPVAYRDVEAPDGTSVRLELHAPEPRAWTLTRDADRWTVGRAASTPVSATCIVQCTADTAWRLFYNALPASEARARLQVTGDPALAEPLLRARSVVL